MATILETDYALFRLQSEVAEGDIATFVFTHIIEELKCLSRGEIGKNYLPVYQHQSDNYFDIYSVEEFTLYSDFEDEITECLSGISVSSGELEWLGRCLPNMNDEHMRFLAWRVFQQFGVGDSFDAMILNPQGVPSKPRKVSRIDATQEAY